MAAAAKAVIVSVRLTARLKPCPDTNPNATGFETLTFGPEICIRIDVLLYGTSTSNPPNRSKGSQRPSS